ncbi:MAG: hypothetical protein IKX20_09345 [Paludibacteraceae bacterium]|nr:hypothetical protein [Paludibacteraceae bacterium]
MKKTSRILAIVLALVMVLSIGVYAAWNQYQSNDNHNGRITDAVPPISPSPAITNPTLNFSGGGWSGVDTTPVMETVGSTTYAYVTYNGRSKGTQLSKINCNDGTTVWSKQISSTTGGNQLSTPYLDSTNGVIYVAATDYYWFLQNNEFTSNSDWTLSTNAFITVGISDETSYVTIPSGDYISQSFNNTTSGTISTQLTSGLKLATNGTSATVTYTIKRPDNSTDNLKTITVTSANDWVPVEEIHTDKVNATGNYTVTVSVSGADVIIDYVSFCHQTAGIKAYNRDKTVYRSNVAVATYGGQINTPLYVYGNYLYFGTYNGSKYYYQVDLTNTNTSTNTKAYQGDNHFYWAGAYSDGNYVYFGGDGGKFYKSSVTSFGTSVTKTNLSSTATNPGNVRSSVCYYDGYLFFTSQGGYLWRYKISDGTIAYAYIGSSTTKGCSTSTPVISSSGYVYIGSYGTNYKGIFKINYDFTSGSSMTQLTESSPNTITTLPVQASVIIYTNSGTDYIFFTTNVTGGRGYCYSCSSNGYTASPVWDTGSGNFALQGMAAWNGYLTFGNDANTFYVIHTTVS